MEAVILVDEQGKRIGVCEKLEAHRKGLLHEAFSIFIFNSKSECLLQKRAIGKYHSGGLWSNSCCSHPRPGEDVKLAADRRLFEEIGIHCDLELLFDFMYHAHLENNLQEHEWDYVFIGFSDDWPLPDENEVSDFKYITIGELEENISTHPEAYTSWLKLCLPRLKHAFSQRGIVLQ